MRDKLHDRGLYAVAHVEFPNPRDGTDADLILLVQGVADDGRSGLASAGGDR